MLLQSNLTGSQIFKYCFIYESDEGYLSLLGCVKCVSMLGVEMKYIMKK